MRNQFLLCLFAFSLFATPELQAQSSELAQVVEAPMRRVELPSQSASVQELEDRRTPCGLKRISWTRLTIIAQLWERLRRKAGCGIKSGLPSSCRSATRRPKEISSDPSILSTSLRTHAITLGLSSTSKRSIRTPFGNMNGRSSCSPRPLPFTVT